MGSSLSDNSVLVRKLQKELPAQFKDFLYPDGNVSLSPNANGNYSVTPQVFYRNATPTSFVFGARGALLLTEISVLVNGAAAPVRADYGSIVGGLTNGYEIGVIANIPDQPVDTFYPLSDLIVDNEGLFAYLEGFEFVDFSANDIVRWRSRQAGGLKLPTLIGLPFDWNARVAVQLNDDFSGLNDHYFKIAGYHLENPENWVLTA